MTDAGNGVALDESAAKGDRRRLFVVLIALALAIALVAGVWWGVIAFQAFARGLLWFEFLPGAAFALAFVAIMLWKRSGFGRAVKSLAVSAFILSLVLPFLWFCVLVFAYSVGILTA